MIIFVSIFIFITAQIDCAVTNTPDSNYCKTTKCKPNEKCVVNIVNKKPIESCVPECANSASCNLECPYGKIQDTNGCDTCRCNNPCSSMTCKSGTERCEVKRSVCAADATTCPFVAVCVKKCPKLNCRSFCKYGNEVDANGCSTCACTDPCKTKNCSPIQECVPHRFKCPSPPCKYMAQCVDKTSTCECYGDLHCSTFDGAGVWDYQGTCKFVLAKSIANSGLTSFIVYMKNVNLYENTNVAFVDMIEIVVYEKIIRLERKSKSSFSPIVLKVDNTMVNIPYSLDNYEDDSYLRVTYRGSDVRVVTSFGLTIEFGYSRFVSISLSQAYQNKTEGFCGNFDGDASNDNQLKDGKHTSDAGRETGRLIGDSWVVLDNGQYETQCMAPEAILDNCEEASQNCKLITQSDGAFSECLKYIGASVAQTYMDDCLHDFSAFNCDESAVCHNLAHFASRCAALGYATAWRTPMICPCQCEDANSECRSVESSACQPTCSNQDSGSDICDLGAVADVCLCKAGFVLFNSTCVPSAQCGCVNYKGEAVMLGDTWLEDSCTSKHVCAIHGRIDVSLYTCQTGESCSNDKCVPINSGSTSTTSTTTTTTITTMSTLTTKKSSNDQCQVKPSDRIDCGLSYFNDKMCVKAGCCYEAFNSEQADAFKCFKPAKVNSQCNVKPSDRISCKVSYVTEEMCIKTGCCFEAASKQCFKPNQPDAIQKCEPLKNCYACKSGYQKDPKTNCDVCSCVDPCEKNNCTALQECVTNMNKTSYICMAKCCPVLAIPKFCDVYAVKNKCTFCKKSCTEITCGANRICCSDYYGCKTCEVPVKC